MERILHRCAKITEAVRWAIQNSQKSLKTLARKYAINSKTVAKWKKGISIQVCLWGLKIHTPVF